jgi:Dyp-type peroxidase family
LRGGAGDVWAVNVALTESGLRKFGVTEEERLRFSAEFCEGMAPKPMHCGAIPRRCNLLGDVGENSPEKWEWGGWKGNGEIDGILLLYAANTAELAKLIKYEMGEAQRFGAQFLQSGSRSRADPLILRGRLPRNRKEHFGFYDGISQPIINGDPRFTSDQIRKYSKTSEGRVSLVMPGEFVIGYNNERDSAAGVKSRGNRGSSDRQSRDLTRNGTHLVFRQLEQNVEAFHHDTLRMAKFLSAEYGKDVEEMHEWVKARLVGRWTSGEPLVPPPIYKAREQDETGDASPEEEWRMFLKKTWNWLMWPFTKMRPSRRLSARPSPLADLPKGKRGRNDFLYYFEDRFGLACPLGAHIRRANPRDLIGPTPDTALRLSKMHRIIRRGRPYGTKSTKRRGMLFICLNADIARQFEFIQHNWLNNGRFDGLYSETDPLLNYPGEDRALTIQGRPTSERMEGFAQYVTVRGGAYFFLPGIEALRSLAD